MSDKYLVYSIDVWSGEEPGLWDKNDWFRIGEITIDEDFTNQDILNELVALDFLHNDAGLEIHNHDCEGNYYEIVRVNDQYPILDLNKVTV